MNKTPGWWNSFFSSGEYERLALECSSDVEMAKRLGVGVDALQKARRRARGKGIAAPGVQELHTARSRGERTIIVNGDSFAEDSPRIRQMQAEVAVKAATYPQTSATMKGAVGYGTWSNGAGRLTDDGNPGDAFGDSGVDVDLSDWDEEPTNPGTTAPWGVVPSLSPSSFAEGTQPRIWQPTDFRNPDSLPYEKPQSSSTRKLTRDECPDGTMILWASDVHIPVHNVPATRLMIECAERVGVSRVVLGGDILDMNCLSKHAKEAHRVVEHATVLEEVEPGREFLNWAATKQTDYILGNHEDRLKRFVDENPAFHGSVVSNFAQVCDLPRSINVLDGEVRLGNLSMFHGHREFKNGSGGQYPAHKILNMFPDQSSIFGHLHRKATAYRTTRDENGINRTRRAWAMGHMSLEHEHYSYVSRSPNWQTGFGLIRVFWEDDRPRWTVYPIEVLSDRYNQPYFEFESVVYR